MMGQVDTSNPSLAENFNFKPFHVVLCILYICNSKKLNNY